MSVKVTEICIAFKGERFRKLHSTDRVHFVFHSILKRSCVLLTYDYIRNATI